MLFRNELCRSVYDWDPLNVVVHIPVTEKEIQDMAEAHRVAKADQDEKDNQITLELLKNEMRNGILKQCPWCGLHTNRVGGCIHISTCPCRKDWCFHCGQPWFLRNHPRPVDIGITQQQDQHVPKWNFWDASPLAIAKFLVLQSQ